MTSERVHESRVEWSGIGALFGDAIRTGCRIRNRGRQIAEINQTLRISQRRGYLERLAESRIFKGQS